MNNSYPSSKPSLWHQPKKIAFIIAVIIGVWVLSGLLFPSNREEAVSSENSTSKDKPTDLSSVPLKFEKMTAQTRARTIMLNGVAEPDRLTLIEAETEGKVNQILLKEGQSAKAGDILIKLDMRDRYNSLAEARAVLKQRQVELKAARKLFEEGFQSKVRLSQAEAALASARRQLKQANLDISYTNIKAPYDGMVEEVLVEEGDLVGKGFNTQTVMHFVDLSPLKITGQLSEKDRGKVKKGDNTQLRFSDGTRAEGKIRFIASVADRDTRTFRLEIEVPNEDGKLQAGVSVEISLLTDEQKAYKIASSVLSLDDAGTVGVKQVDDSGLVRFTPVEVIAQDNDGVWVAGLADSVTLVTQGVSFISDGQKIKLTSPTGRGQNSETILGEGGQSLTTSPHPSPLPEGEGAKQ